MGFILPITENFNDNLIFLNTANSYLKQGWSVIPVHGCAHPEKSKVAVVRWSPFTHRCATENVLHHWFEIEKHQGIAIITGRISGLAVLDFDSENRFQSFCHTYPQLANTYTVKTPRGYHLYFAIPQTCHPKSLKGQGIDWQWEGRYVVAPPTRGYSSQNSLNPRLLTQGDISNIETFINVSTPLITRYEPSQQSITQNELQSLYSKQAHPGQRNEVLFKSALTARDMGWTQSATMQVLIDLHSHNRHQDESLQGRRAEAKRTIASAFSRQAKRKTVFTKAIANNSREALMQMGLTAAIRVIEGLRQLGLPDGAYFSRTEAIQALEGLVGEHSIVKALTALLDDDVSLFHTVSAHQPPLENPPSPKGLATDSSQRHISKCLEIRFSKPHFSQSGRKTYWYQLPSNAELAEKLGLELSAIADELNLEALSSAKATRQGLYRAYIARRPGAYPNRWLAERSGISITTKNRYDHEIPDLHKRATYTEIAIYWQNIEEIPTMDVPGCFLQDERGKRYPAQQAVARYLLSQKRQLRLMKQGVNYYWVGSRFDVSQTQVNTVREIRPPWLEKATHYRMKPLHEAISVTRPETPRIEPACTEYDLHSGEPHTATVMPAKRHNHLAGHLPHRPFKDEMLEHLAIQIQERVNRIATKQTSKLSLTSSRRLMVRYGTDAILKSLKQVERTQDVQNPAGLLTVILRSDAKHGELQALMRQSG